MKRVNNLFQKIYSLDNLNLADSVARKGKLKQTGVQIHILNAEKNIAALQKMIVDKTFKTSAYSTFFIYEPKEREIFRLPYFPDRIMHHAIMNVLEPVFVSCFTKDTYSCIKGKGVHAAAKAVKQALQNEGETTFCLKFDIKKFYPNIDHTILKNLLRRKIKDAELLNLLDEIIDSAPGLPIGNYLSQYFANFYLTGFDHWVKEDQQVKYYFRYADDVVILSNNKNYLHNLLAAIRCYLSNRLHLTIKENYQIFPVSARSIDFVGYRFYHRHTLLRKNIKKNFARMLVIRKNPASVAAYLGWTKHCNSRHLVKKLISKQ